MFHPSRGGVRGGKDQFSWDSVKEDKHRENYLGHSLMAPVGRWQKGKDLTWYAKERHDAEGSNAMSDELARIKEAEADAMAVALGVKKKKTIESHVTQEELRFALKKHDSDVDVDVNEEKGLGYGRSSRLPLGQQSMEMMNAPQMVPTIVNMSRRSMSPSEHRSKKHKHSDKKHKHSDKKHKHSDKKHKSHKEDRDESYETTHRESNRESHRESHRTHHRENHRENHRESYEDSHREKIHREKRKSPSPSYTRDSHRDSRDSFRPHHEPKHKLQRERSLSPYSRRIALSKHTD
ncbi:kinase phosphorylation protein-domain-containing protein [Spinellus fusiger]|nr:kinase phosphorylation protein-domain-containing protein [Spinellus fusiger]